MMSQTKIGVNCFFNCIFTILLSLFRIKIYLQQYFIWLCCDNNKKKKKYNFKIKL